MPEKISLSSHGDRVKQASMGPTVAPPRLNLPTSKKGGFTIFEDEAFKVKDGNKNCENW